MEDLKAKHRKELKDLKAKVTALKKTANNDKKRKKDILEEIERLERETERRHQLEIDEMTRSEASQGPESAAVEDGDTEIKEDPKDTPKSDTEQVEESMASVSVSSSSSKSKASRQQLRKQRKQAQMEQMRREAEQEAAEMPDTREIEHRKLVSLLELHGMAIHDVPADGHCLYNAICHELKLLKNPLSFKELRKMAADYMMAHSEDFIPFLTLESGGFMDDEAFVAYCDKVRDTAEWGGQCEIMALAKALKRPIHVYQADGPLLKIGEDFSGEPILLSY